MIANEPLVKIGKVVTNFAIKSHLPVERLIRATVFDHFCGGVNEFDCLSTVDRMYEKNVCSVLDYSVEGKDTEDPLDDALAMVLKVLDFVKEKGAIPFAVFKPTGYGRFSLFHKVNEGKTLTEDEKAEWARVVKRFDKTCKKAHDLGVSLLIDAEESWIQDAADLLVEEMMLKYNKENTVVFNTLQMYRWDRMDYLKKLHKKAKNEGFKLGFKVVRGAYMEKENERAEEKGYATPICASKQETDENFDCAINYMLEHLEDMEIFAGTHNENSSYKLMELMKEKGIEPTDSRVWFGQLYGMSDHISFNLAANGYHVPSIYLLGR